MGEAAAYEKFLGGRNAERKRKKEPPDMTTKGILKKSPLFSLSASIDIFMPVKKLKGGEKSWKARERRGEEEKARSLDLWERKCKDGEGREGLLWLNIDASKMERIGRGSSHFSTVVVRNSGGGRRGTTPSFLDPRVMPSELLALESESCQP